MAQARSPAHDGVHAAPAPLFADAGSAPPSLLPIILGVVVVVSLIIGWLTPGYRGDLNENKSWSRTIVRNGIQEAYRSNIDYAPVPLYVFGAVGWLYQRLVDPSWNEDAAHNSHILTFMMKAPMIAAHVAITGVIFMLGAVTNHRLGSLAALAYGLNPATLYDIAHFGQADALVGLAAILCLSALSRGQAILTGVFAAILLATKPQGWIVLPIVVLALLWRWPWRQTLVATGAAAVTILALISPWLVTGRAHHIWRYLENLNTHALSNRVISADAHNLWWIPTLMHWDWIEDSARLLGPLSYRTVALALALTWLAFCIWSLRFRAQNSVLLIAGAASFGFFMLMVRAHENHAYLAATILAGALAAAPGRSIARVLAVVSLALLMNLVLRDPLIMDPYTSIPDPGQEAPPILLGLQLVNVALNIVALMLLGLLLWRRSTPRPAAP